MDTAAQHISHDLELVSAAGVDGGHVVQAGGAQRWLQSLQ